VTSGVDSFGVLARRRQHGDGRSPWHLHSGAGGVSRTSSRCGGVVVVPVHKRCHPLEGSLHAGKWPAGQLAHFRRDSRVFQRTLRDHPFAGQVSSAGAFSPKLACSVGPSLFHHAPMLQHCKISMRYN
jgi:hypothetical protein